MLGAPEEPAFTFIGLIEIPIREESSTLKLAPFIYPPQNK